MSKENCSGFKCHICLNDSACCSGEYQPLIDDTMCNTCLNAPCCYDVLEPVFDCTHYKIDDTVDVPLAASAPRHIDTCESCRDTCTLAPWCSSCCMCERYERGED